RRVDIVLVFSRLVTFEALLGGIGDQRLGWITRGPGLEAPASRRRVALFVLRHDSQNLRRTFDVGALGDGKFAHVVDQDGFVRIWSAFLQRRRSGRIDVNAVHSA